MAKRECQPANQKNQTKGFTVFKLHHTDKDVLNVETRGGCSKITEFVTCKYVVLNVETVIKAKNSTMNNLNLKDR